MPKLRQPCLLRMISFNVLLEYVVKCCDEHSSKNSLEKLGRSVAAIKENICRHMPGELLTDFCNKFLSKFYVEGRPASHNKAALEIIMDLGNKKLVIQNSLIMNDMDPSDAHRLRGLEILYIEESKKMTIPTKLENFYLADLTEINYLQDCDDFHLELIGNNCPKLRELGIRQSERVTKKGLCGLNGLSDMRSISIADCPKISFNIIYEVLFVHKKIEDLTIYLEHNSKNANTFSRLKLGGAVFPSVKCLAIPLISGFSPDMKSIAFVFPNLTSIEFSGYVTGDLQILKTLNNLSVLDFTNAYGLSWANLKELLITNGSKIKELRVGSACATQNDLNTVFKYCPKMKTLVFPYSRKFGAKVLSVPPFKKLEKLQCFGEYEGDIHLMTQLEFGEMSKLESLLIDNFYFSTAMAEEIILDDKKFPNLRFLLISAESCDVSWLKKMVKYRNLNINVIRA